MTNMAVIEMGIRQESWIDYRGEHSMPTDTTLACSYGLHILVDLIEEAALFRRTNTHDELWLCTDAGSGCVYYTARAGTERVACRRLFEFMARYRQYAGLRDFIEGGLITQDEYDGILEKIREGQEANRQEALARETPIVKMARRLGLMPEPNGLSHNQWTAQCPRGTHRLMISAEGNEFGCGYCRVKGGPDVLRDHVGECKNRRCK